MQPYGRYGNAGETSKTISTIASLWPVKAILEKRAATVVVATFISPVFGGHLKPVTLKPVIRIFVSAFSAFSAFSFCGISSGPCFPGLGGTSAFSAFSLYQG